MEIDNYVLFFILIWCGIALITLLFNKDRRIRRKLQRAPHKTMAEFQNGDMAKVIGSVHAIENHLIAPLSGRKCVQYHIVIEKARSNEDGDTWTTIVDEFVKSKFTITDRKNHAYINDMNVKHYIVKDKEYSSGFLKDATLPLEKYLSSKKISVEGVLGFNKKLRYKEGILAPNEKVAALGQGNWKSAQDLNLPEFYKNILEITATEKHPVYLSDHEEVVKIKQTTKYKRNLGSGS